MTHISAVTAARPSQLRNQSRRSPRFWQPCLPPSALALDEQSGEAKLIKSCEERLCTMLLRKEPKGDDLKCELTKTWAKSTIKEAENHTLKWSYGDARCSVQLHISRATIVTALTSPEYAFEVPPHTADCVVEQDGEARNVKATLAPKIAFKNGKAEKVWVNLKGIKGPVGIKTSLWLAASLNDNVGLFHRPMLTSINRFIDKYCPKHYPTPCRPRLCPRVGARCRSKPAAASRAPSPTRRTAASLLSSPRARADVPRARISAGRGQGEGRHLLHGQLFQPGQACRP